MFNGATVNVKKQSTSNYKVTLHNKYLVNNIILFCFDLNLSSDCIFSVLIWAQFELFCKRRGKANKNN